MKIHLKGFCGTGSAGILLGVMFVMLGSPQRTEAAALTNLTVSLSLITAGKISVHDEPMDVARLPRKLKSMGANTQTPITFSIPEDTPVQSLTPVSRELYNAGFRKFVFVRPRQITATVDLPSKSTPGNTNVTHRPGRRKKSAGQ